MGRHKSQQACKPTIRKFEPFSKGHEAAARAQLAAKQAELKDVEAQHMKLLWRRQIVLDICEALRLVRECELCRPDRDNNTNLAFEAALHDLDETVASLTATVDQSVHPAEVERMRAVSVGDQLGFCYSSIRMEALAEQPASAAVLTGTPLSILLCGLLSYLSDSTFRNTLAKVRLLGHAEQDQDISSSARYIQGMCAEVVQSAAASGHALPPAKTVLPLAAFYTGGYGAAAYYLLADGQHAVNQGMVSRDEESSFGQLPSEALLDHAAEKLQLTEQQLGSIISGLELFSELQRPIDLEQAAIVAEMQQLLQQQDAHQLDELTKVISTATGSSSSDAAAAAAVAAIASGCQQAATVAARALCSTGGSMGVHQELLRLARRLELLLAKLKWLDLCATSYIDGQLTWLQIARYQLAISPCSPGILPLGRRLMSRRSLWVECMLDWGSQG